MTKQNTYYIAALHLYLQANPWVSAIGWTLNGDVLDKSNALDVRIDSSSLLITNVSRRHVGEYQCWAENAQGRGESETIPLNIHCKSTRLTSADT